MACFHPIPAWIARDGGVVFVEHQADGGKSLFLPCGRCIGCRLERSRQWAVRCVQESKVHGANSFLTLTYDDDHLPVGGSLCYRDFQLFMKRLRKVVRKVDKGCRLRFFMCGEYGDQLERPHFHVCLFGFDFSQDRYLWSQSGGFKLYRSRLLESVWPFGFATVGALNFETAAYTARYVVKKVTGDLAKDHYARVDPESGEVRFLEPEFCRCSLKPGIGAPFLEKFFSDVFPRDYVVMNGKKSKVPRFYDRFLEKVDPDLYDQLKADRELEAVSRLSDESWERLAVREQVSLGRLNLSRRNKV